jgi:hypothetical protein
MGLMGYSTQQSFGDTHSTTRIPYASHNLYHHHFKSVEYFRAANAEADAGSTHSTFRNRCIVCDETIVGLHAWLQSIKWDAFLV